MLVDSHCHLNYEGLVEDIAGTISRANEAGVGFLLSINTKLDEFSDVLTTAEKYPNVACTVGVHPHEVTRTKKADSKTLIELANHPKVVGIGETGLDFYYNNSPPDMQEESFLIHIEASRKTQLPIIIHTRDADDHMIRILEAEQSKGSFPGVIHCFSGGEDLAHCAIKHDMAISISGIITFKSADNLRNTIKSIPIENILIETDAPFLAPIPHRGKTNEPSFVVHTASKVAEIFSLTPAEIAEITTRNFFRLFSKAKRQV